MTIYCMFVAVMAFFAKISDPRSGGTYMTLLNTLSNLGGTWPSTVILFFVDPLTWNSCTEICKSDIQVNIFLISNCQILVRNQKIDYNFLTVA